MVDMALCFRILLAVVATCGLVSAVIGLRIGWYLCISRQLTHRIRPFERMSADGSPRILYVGDSTGYGTGASDSVRTVPGRIGLDYPDAHIENWSRRGLKLRTLASALSKALTPEHPYDLVVLAVGGMDIVHATSLERMDRALRAAIQEARRLGLKVLYVGPNNPAAAPLFHFPFNRVYRRRGMAWQERFMHTCAENSVACLSLHREDDPVALGGHFAGDQTHPTDEGYALWYVQIRPHVERLLSA